MTVTSTPPGAAVRVNDNFFGETPAKLKLVAGDYTIAIELPGFTIWKRSLKLASGSAISVDARVDARNATTAGVPACPAAAPKPAPPSGNPLTQRRPTPRAIHSD